jgi:hypothetical protein
MDVTRDPEVHFRFVHRTSPRDWDIRDMSKNKAFLLVGPAVPGADELHDQLVLRADQLTEAGLALPEVTQADLFRAGVEIRRTHRTEGLRRKDVEGAWARVCRKAEKAKGDVLIAQDAYAAASPSEIALALDGLAAFAVHVVLTIPPGTEGVDDLIEPWTQLLKPARLHVLTLGEDDGLDEVVAAVTTLALKERAAQLENRIEKLRKKRKKLKKQLAAIDSA